MNTTARYDVMGLGHDAYRDLIAALGGPCQPEIIGWCELDVDGTARHALVVTQAWPLALPFGTDPKSIRKAKRYAAVIAEVTGCFRIVPIDKPPSVDLADRWEAKVRERMKSTGESFTTASRRVDSVITECPTCIGAGRIRDGETREMRKCLDCNGAGVS